MLENRASVNAFLYFGYVPDPAVRPPAWLGGLAPRPSSPGPRPSSAWIAEGVGLLKRIFRDALCNGTTAHIVPLSGGLDSRAILGGLLENIESRQIQAVTFGTPGLWDFEIGQQVARVAGVRYATIDLSSQDWTWDTAELMKTAGRVERPVGVFDTHVNRQIPERFGAQNVYWSGFMGDPLSGSHLPLRDSATWDQARRRFAQRNRASQSVALTPPGFDPQRALPSSPVYHVAARAPGGEGSYDEQLDFTIRQQCLVRHIVLPRGYDYRTPFLQPAWASFILSVPRRYRQGQYLYREILKAADARLFSLPTTHNLGLPLDAPRWRKEARILRLGVRGLARRIAPNLCYSVPPGRNYMDFDRAIRRRKDLRTVIGENLQDLKKRGLIDWMEIEDIWRRHQRGHENHADALMLLASLEIHLKVQDKVGT